MPAYISPASTHTPESTTQVYRMFRSSKYIGLIGLGGGELGAAGSLGAGIVLIAGKQGIGGDGDESLQAPFFGGARVQEVSADGDDAWVWGGGMDEVGEEELIEGIGAEYGDVFEAFALDGGGDFQEDGFLGNGGLGV